MNQENAFTISTPVVTGLAVDGVRKDLANRLPGLIDDALTRYLVFSKNDPPAKARDFTAFSTACRAAIAHLEQLLKLAQALSPGEVEGSGPGDDIEALVAGAEKALEKAAEDA
jgi:hypothetical protein